MLYLLSHIGSGWLKALAVNGDGHTANVSYMLVPLGLNVAESAAKGQVPSLIGFFTFFCLIRDKLQDVLHLVIMQVVEKAWGGQ